MQWSQKQEKVLEMFRTLKTSELGVVRGYAGTGKSSILKAAADDLSVVVLAPTGKAARRVSELSGLDARTLHSFLYKATTNEYGDVNFERRLGEDLSDSLTGVDLIAVDEASMLSRELYRDIREVSMEFGVPLVLIGDGYQLPPVEKAVTEDKFSAMSDEFIGQNANKFVELDEVFRQAKESPILRVATEIRQGGDIPSLLAEAFEWLSIPQVVTKGAEIASGVDGIVVCHRNETRHALNRKIRSEAGFFGRAPEQTEKLMVTKNDYLLGLSNGEILPMERPAVPLTKMAARVKDTRLDKMQEINYFTTKIKGLPIVLSGEGLDGTLQISEWAVMKNARQLVTRAELEPHTYLYANYGYAATAHKAQGSQYDDVVMILEPTVKVYEKDGRRWVYTTLTRAIKNFYYSTLTFDQKIK